MSNVECRSEFPSLFNIHYSIFNIRLLTLRSLLLCRKKCIYLKGKYSNALLQIILSFSSNILTAYLPGELNE